MNNKVGEINLQREMMSQQRTRFNREEIYWELKENLQEGRLK